MSSLIHTCYRVFDLDESVAFYEKLGLKEHHRLPIGDKAVNVYMGHEGDGPRLELTFNYDQEEPYEIGTGYGHIAFIVDDLDSTLEKPPYTVSEGGSRLCFVRDPDGYRIELIEGDPARAD